MQREERELARRCRWNFYLQSSVLASIWLALATLPIAFSIQPNTQQIVRLSIAAAEAGWKELPHFSDIERDVDIKGGVTTEKTYKVLMIDGSPYSRLIAVDGKPLAPADGRREGEKLQSVIVMRATESSKQRAKRTEQYQKDRNRMFTLLHAMAEAFDFKLVGEQKLNTYDVYVLAAKPRPGYKPTSRETAVLTGMKGKLWIDRENYQWVKVEAEVVKPVWFGRFIAKVMPGTNFVLEQAPVSKGLWLPRHYRVEVNARILWLRKSYIHDETYKDYRPISTNSLH